MGNPDNGYRLGRVKGIMATLAAMGMAACANAEEAPKSANKPDDVKRVATLEASELDKTVLSKIVADYKACIDENIAFVKTLDNKDDQAEMTEYGEEACKESMETALHIADNKAEMRALTDSLIQQAKEEAGISGT